MPNDPREREETGDRSFADILNEFESANRPAEKAGKAGGKRKGKAKAAPRAALRGTVVGISGDFFLIDYGAKAEGIIPSADLRDPDGSVSVKRGDTFDVAITGYNTEGMATLSRIKGPRPRDWEGLSHSFENKEIVAGRVTGMVKGGFTVDLGARAFM